MARVAASAGYSGRALHVVALPKLPWCALCGHVLAEVRTAAEFLDERLRRRWLLLVPMAVACAALEALATIAVFILLRTLTGAGEPPKIPVVAKLLGTRAGWSGEHLAIAFAVVVGLLFVTRTVVGLVGVWLLERFCGDATVRVSTQLLGAYLRAPYALHLRRDSAGLIRNCMGAADQVSRGVLAGSVGFCSELLIVLGVVASLIWVLPGVMMIAGMGLVALLAPMLYVTQRRHRLWGRRAHALNRRILQSLQEIFGGIVEIRVTGLRGFFASSFAARRAELADIFVRRSVLTAAPRFVLEMIMVLGIVAMLVAVQVRGDATAGAEAVSILGALGYAWFRILPSVNRMMGYLSNMRFASGVLERLYDDWTDPSLEQAGEAGPDVRPLAFTSALAFHGVSYTYPGTDRPAVQDLTFSIARGESVGVVGATGAGKSTLVLLLLGLLEPDEGRVTVDDVDIRRAGRAWRSTVAYVPHPAFVVNETVRRNIALGIEERDVDERRVKDAASVAQLRELVGETGAGLERPVGERGDRLSAGERQRIAVARAVYRRAELLVFDEATAALDNQTEHAVADAIESLHEDRTLIVIAHRLSTVRACTRLLFLRNGRLDDVGTYDELMTRNVPFRRMAAIDLDDGGEGRCL